MSVDWAAVYRSTYTDLVRFLYRKVWDADRARDLAQDTFVRAMGGATEPESPRRLLFTIAANLARDEARGAILRRRHLALLRTETEAAPRSAPTPAEQLARRERRDEARRALAALGPRDREVLLLWHAGQSYREIAEQTGMSIGSIGTTLARARRRLVEAHQAQEITDVAR